jgi:hypothetical protein
MVMLLYFFRVQLLGNLYQPRKASLGVSLCILLVGCSPGNAKTSSTMREVLEREQATTHIVIGRTSGDQLEYLDMTSDAEFRVVSFAQRQEVPGASINLVGKNEIQSSDGRWLAHCDKGEVCVISQSADSRQRFSVSCKGLLTALYWSPSGRFVFFVRKAPKWRFPPRCSLEDERDVIVHDLATGREGIVSTVCGGFPYGSLRWYRLTTN